MAGRGPQLLRSSGMRFSRAMLECELNAVLGVSGNVRYSSCRLPIHADLQDIAATSEAYRAFAPSLAALLEPSGHRGYHRLGYGVHSQLVLRARFSQSFRD